MANSRKQKNNALINGNGVLFVILAGFFLTAACSPVISDWAPLNSEPYHVTVLAPVFSPNSDSNFKNPAALVKAISAFSTKGTENGRPSIGIDLMDWVQYQKKINEVWKTINSEYKKNKGYFDPAELADLLSDYELFTHDRALIVRIAAQKTEQTEIATVEGFRLLKTKDSGVEANHFAVSFVIDPKTLSVTLSGFIVNLLNRMAYSAPSFDKMGFISLEKGCFKTEKDQSETCQGPFYLGKYPITQNQWAFVMETKKFRTKGGNFPVVDVSKEDISVFLEKLNEKTGKSFRLPTELEWEYACQKGPSQQNYGTSDGKINHDRGNFSGLGGRDMWAGRAPVGSFPPSPSGLHDMAGNVWEWTENQYRDPTQNAFFAFLENLGKTDRHAVKGGSFDETAENLSCKNHRVLSAGTQAGDVGLRLLLTE